MTKAELEDGLIKAGYLKTPEIIRAFRAVDRAHFVGAKNRKLAYEDTALPIGYGATISQPLVVAFMLELLQPQAGDKILDIGSGSGWTSAILAEITGSGGRVTGMEIIPELTILAKETAVKHYPELVKRVTFVTGNAANGYPAGAPYKRITAAAALADKIPEAWKKQLAVHGRIVAPVSNAIHLIEKTGENAYKEEVFPGFIFVPFQYDGA